MKKGEGYREKEFDPQILFHVPSLIILISSPLFREPFSYSRTFSSPSHLLSISIAFSSLTFALFYYHHQCQELLSLSSTKSRRKNKLMNLMGARMRISFSTNYSTMRAGKSKNRGLVVSHGMERTKIYGDN